MRETPAVLFSREQIARRVSEIASEVAREFEGRSVSVVGIMKGCLVFMADMIRAIPLDTTCHFLHATSYREEGSGHARTAIVYSTEVPYEGQEILLLGDVVDTGITLSFLLDHIRERGPRRLKVCTLIDKAGERKVDVQPDWAAFSLNEPLEGFIVGYGLDHAERYRGLPYLGTIPRPGAPGEGRKITISPGSGL
ncbi:MAG TPA: hypoxanthine phosphoribosyltransferase [Vicinamibacteria bacterium]